ncbi:MAG: TIGR03905 family TSCPD domain-containing protein [Spirochaetaceae bacterium]|nr:TIGR03905 family TSCPD domain-containing protein [Spirochaetaceae bacterium]
MQKSFQVSGVCTDKIDIEIKDNTVSEVRFNRGCPGNLFGISKLVQGKKIDDVISLLEGIPCGNKATSCPDQLAQSLKTFTL